MKLETETMEEAPHLRPMASEMSLLSRSDGSASFSQGDTCVIASVNGPGEVKISKEQIDSATVELLYKPKTGIPGCSERYSESIMLETCKAAIIASLFPRTAISITLQEMQDSGSKLACGVNAACLALLDAAVPLQFMVAAVSCAIDEDEKIIVDPSLQEEREATASAVFAFDSQKYDVVAIEVKGTISQAQFKTCRELCQTASKKIFKLYHEAVEKKLKKIFRYK